MTSFPSPKTSRRSDRGRVQEVLRELQALAHAPGHESGLRMKVNLFLDIPTTLERRLSKGALRTRDVRVEGAGWDRALYYCNACGWNLRLGP